MLERLRNLINIPEPLKRLRVWVGARTDSKAPINVRTGRPASVADENTWSSWDDAVTAMKTGMVKNVGFVFSGRDGYVGIDLDHCYQDGQLSALARDWVTAMGSYTERSRSGDGLHIIVRGQLPAAVKRAGLEVYSAGRYFILTGDILPGAPRYISEADISPLLAQHVERYTDTRNYSLSRIQAAYAPVYEHHKTPTIKLKGQYPPIVRGGRNNALTSLTGLLIATGYPMEYVDREVHRANADACAPPLPEAEVRQILRSASRYMRR